MSGTSSPAPPDYGFFGPDSAAWKVFSYPSTFTLAFQRTVVTEMFEPFLLASVNDTQGVMSRPALRYDRTLQYMAMIVFGDSESVLKAADILVRIHSRIVGTEPISGLPYNANDPEAQLWIHLTAWHSVLYCYEKFGPGQLSPAEEHQYWAECARAAEFQTIDIATVPRSREEMRAYYERMRPILAATEATQEHVDALLDGVAVLLPKRTPRLFAKLLTALNRRATIASLPRRLRRMAGITQSPLTDSVVTAIMRMTFRLIAAGPLALRRVLIRQASPLTAAVVDHVLTGVAPLEPKVWDPAEARRHYDIPRPADRVAELAATFAVRPRQAHAPRDDAKQLLTFRAS